MRVIYNLGPRVFIEWLGVTVDGEPTVMPSTFAAVTRTVDLLVQIGPDRLLHVEYMLTPEPDIAIRMAGYRAAIMAAHPGMRITQYAIVLKDGNTTTCDDPDNGFSLGYLTRYLRDSPPGPLQAHPSLTPLTALAAGDHETRAAGLLATYRLIQTLPPERAAELSEAATVLASIRLDPSTIDQIRKETTLTVESIADFESQTEVGQELLNRGHVQTLDALVRDRFGDHPQIPKIALRLARSYDLPTAVRTITHATRFEDLLA